MEEERRIYSLLAKIHVKSKKERRPLTRPELSRLYEEVYGKKPDNGIFGDYIKKEERSLK